MRARPAVREYASALLVGAAGAGLVLLAVRQDWARVVTRADGPLPASAVGVMGQALVPVAAALGVAALAGLVAVIATRRAARRAMGVVLAAFGVAIAVAVSVHGGTAAVLAAAHTAPLSQAGSVTAGEVPGARAGAAGSGLPGVGVAGHVVMVGAVWRAAAVAGALAVIASGALVAWRGQTWPTMSSRYDAPNGAPPERGTDSAGMWESLSMGDDPTDGTVSPRGGDAGTEVPGGAGAPAPAEGPATGGR